MVAAGKVRDTIVAVPNTEPAPTPDVFSVASKVVACTLVTVQVPLYPEGVTPATVTCCPWTNPVVSATVKVAMKVLPGAVDSVAAVRLNTVPPACATRAADLAAHRMSRIEPPDGMPDRGVPDAAAPSMKKAF